jgi:hypothetical protein
LLPLLAAGIAVAMVAVYLQIIRTQGNTPAWWFVALMLVAAGFSAYGALGRRDRRTPALTMAAFLFLGLGFVSILTIGLPILLAAVLAGIGATLATRGS